MDYLVNNIFIFILILNFLGSTDEHEITISCPLMADHPSTGLVYLKDKNDAVLIVFERAEEDYEYLYDADANLPTPDKPLNWKWEIMNRDVEVKPIYYSFHDPYFYVRIKNMKPNLKLLKIKCCFPNQSSMLYPCIDRVVFNSTSKIIYSAFII